MREREAEIVIEGKREDGTIGKKWGWGWVEDF